MRSSMAHMRASRHRNAPSAAHSLSQFCATELRKGICRRKLSRSMALEGRKAAARAGEAATTAGNICGGSSARGRHLQAAHTRTPPTRPVSSAVASRRGAGAFEGAVAFVVPSVDAHGSGPHRRRGRSTTYFAQSHPQLGYRAAGPCSRTRRTPRTPPPSRSSGAPTAGA
jgi:hypothetical protein